MSKNPNTVIRVGHRIAGEDAIQTNSFLRSQSQLGMENHVAALIRNPDCVMLWIRNGNHGDPVYLKGKPDKHATSGTTR